jgi:hypothetical protein
MSVRSHLHQFFNAEQCQAYLHTLRWKHRPLPCPRCQSHHIGRWGTYHEHTGSGRLRTALYMATLSAAQDNLMIKALYIRLRAAGKPEKVARCASARKLFHIAWTVVRKTQWFDPSSARQMQRA